MSEYTGTSATPTRAETYTFDPVTGGMVGKYIYVGRLPNRNALPDDRIEYAFDQVTGRLLQTSTFNTTIDDTYDKLGRLETVTASRLLGNTVPNGGDKTTYTYDSVGNLETETLPNGVKTTYTYDTLNRLDDEVVNKADNSPLAEYDYHVRADGQRDWVLETGIGGANPVKITWGYDNLNRLTSELRDVGNNGPSSTDYLHSFSYDLAGNRMKQKVDTDHNGSTDQTIVYTYSNNDQLLTETATGTGAYATTDTYDLNGSLTEEVRTGDQAKHRTYKWDLRNRMTGVDSNGNGVFTDTGDVAYTYDNDGVRIKEQTLGTGGTTTHFLIDTMNATGYAKAIEEKSDLGVTLPSRTYVLGAGAEEQVDWNASEGTQTNRYFVRDGHGSTRALTNGSGVITDLYAYTALGDAIGFTPATAKTNWLFGGDGLYDGASGWTYHLARWRDGERFVSYDSFEGDPGSPANLHKYIYANNNPVYLTDPSGHIGVVELGAAMAIGVGLGGIFLGVTLWRGALQSPSRVSGIGGAVIDRYLAKIHDNMAQKIRGLPQAKF